MRDWLPFALVAFFFWGFWAFFPKLATMHISPQSAILYEVLGTIIVGLCFVGYLVFFTSSFRPELRGDGATYAILTGMAGTAGTFFLFVALSKGAKTSVVIPMTALYPLVTILLAFVFLRESLSRKGSGWCLPLSRCSCWHPGDSWLRWGHRA